MVGLMSSEESDRPSTSSLQVVNDEETSIEEISPTRLF